MKLTARIRIDPDTTSIRAAGWAGMSPQFAYRDERILCRLYPEDGDAIPRGEWVRCRVEIPHANRVWTEIPGGSAFQLVVGERRLGEGVVLAAEGRAPPVVP
ncbi:MAG: hypothetical protein ACI8PZ_007319 [Myxococcota bacterium]|jgi:hypothetical protein